MPGSLLVVVSMIPAYVPYNPKETPIKNHNPTKKDVAYYTYL